MSKTKAVAKHGKRVGLEILGWLLIVAGIAGLILPGPGLLGIFAGMVILSQQYEWAEKRVDPVKKKALGGASDAVQTWPRILFATFCALVTIAFGVYWFAQPPAPSWWPIDEQWWLFGGWPPGVDDYGNPVVQTTLEL